MRLWLYIHFDTKAGETLQLLLILFKVSPWFEANWYVKENSARSNIIFESEPLNTIQQVLDGFEWAMKLSQELVRIQIDICVDISNISSCF